jgi:uncharacterized protein
MPAEVRTYSDAVLLAAERLGIRPEAVQTYLDAGHGIRAEGVVRAFHTTIKPTGALCNLDCDYCYYLSKEELLNQRSRRIAESLLESLIIDIIDAQDADEITFTWHGGEPTLLGLAFFERVIALQAKHLPPGRRISNDLQTNGTLLDDDWCRFLARNAFLIGLSIDGPRDLHDQHRPFKGGQASFDKVMEAAGRLTQHGVVFGTLTTVHRHNAKHPLEVYRFLRDELGARYLQFIPCVEPKSFAAAAPGFLGSAHSVSAESPRLHPGHPLSVVTDWSVEVTDWGEFLVAIFDEWAARDRGRVKVNLFENLLAQLAGHPAQLCTHSPTCGKNIAIENDGRVYACDHFVYPEYELGRLNSYSDDALTGSARSPVPPPTGALTESRGSSSSGSARLRELIFSMPQLEFGLDKFRKLPGECKRCPYLKLCWGECPRTRIIRSKAEGEQPGAHQSDARPQAQLSYLCHGWKRFYGHVLPRIRRSSSGGLHGG